LVDGSLLVPVQPKARLLPTSMVMSGAAVSLPVAYLLPVMPMLAWPSNGVNVPPDSVPATGAAGIAENCEL
jgi:hypothetical protein